MHTAKRLVVAYLKILIVLVLVVVALGRLAGPDEVLIACTVAFAAAVYSTIRIVRAAPQQARSLS